jgi:glycosyltransferase involved in cell wall biosynthesis
MKIIHLLYESKGDYFGIGGVGIRAYEIYKYLGSRHDITLLCKKYPGARNREIEGLKHVFVGAESGNLTRALLSYAFSAAQFVREHGNEFDIIIEEFSPAIPTFLHLWTKKPLVLQVQGYTGRLYFKKYNLLYALVLHGLEQVRPRFYRNFIFISDQTMKRFFLKNNANHIVIPNGISHELLNVSPAEGDYILYLGRIDIYGKGLDLLIRAYREFFQSFPHIRLVIAGDGRDMDRFQDLLTGLPDAVRKNIEMVGWVAGNTKKEILQNAIFTVFPSRHEVQPISVLEAMASGKAVLVSDIPEFSFVTEHGAGTSFRSGDSVSLAQSMKEMALSDMRKEIGQRAREFVEDRTWDRIAMVYEQFLQQVIEFNLRFIE